MRRERVLPLNFRDTMGRERALLLNFRGIAMFDSGQAVKYNALWYSQCPIRVTLSSIPVVSPLVRRLGDQYITEYQPIFRPECQPNVIGEKCIICLQELLPIFSHIL
ncbi:hypothetical protein LOAG_13973 [Loa loa]|uniref:Uncharacterized protein n=1 Tax=Loa loa TaxID=7209 RepID=A0A1S0TJI7_LOALO|nr:hypothetical protein LOAG_13973 [Loa loa]EFO14546.1 hypothetical protein LOAG_13973 [Loa loa]